MRSRSRRRTRGASSTTLTSWGMADWDASTALATASGSGVAGSAVTGVSVVAAFRLNAVPATIQILTRRTSGNSGWACRINSASFQWLCGNGTTAVFSPTRTLVAGDVGKLHVAAMSDDLSAVKQYFDAVQVGASTALAGYAAAAINHTIGSAENGVQPAADFTILGVAGRDSALTLADFQTICAATKVAGQLNLGGITMEHMWSSPATATMPATLSDEIGTDAMSFLIGAAANINVVRVSRVWGF